MTDEIAPELEARLRRTLAIVAEATPAGDPAPTPLVARRHRRAVVWGPIVVLAAAGIVAAAVIARGDDARRVQTVAPADTTVAVTEANSTPTTVTSASTTSASVAGTRPELHIEHRTATQPSYTYELQVPTVVGLPTDIAKSIDDELSKVVDSYVADFVKAVDPKFGQAKMQLSVTAPAVLDGYFSVRYDVFEDFNGAHPISRVTARTFDTSDGTSQSLEQQAGGVNHRAHLYELIADALHSTYASNPDFDSKQSTIADLSLADLSGWYPTSAGVHLAFDQGAISSMSAGVVEVIVPVTFAFALPIGQQLLGSGPGYHWTALRPTLDSGPITIRHTINAEIDRAIHERIDSFITDTAASRHPYSYQATLEITEGSSATSPTQMYVLLNWVTDTGTHGQITRAFSLGDGIVIDHVDPSLTAATTVPVVG
jgi:hypothetical protein